MLVARSGERGFTLLEVVIAVVIMVLLSASIFPTVSEQIERRRIDASVKTLKSLADAVTKFRKDTAVNPGSMVDLSNPITTGGTNSCGAAYTTVNVSAWAGPYYTQQLLPATGLPLSSENVGRVNNTLVRSPAGVATAGSLAFQAVNVRLDQATEINEIVDGDASATTGRVRWTTPADANGFVTLSYHVAINGC
jgi:prepilin-type N-terminal cleavage/methylation domain-containing protein